MKKILFANVPLWPILGDVEHFAFLSDLGYLGLFLWIFGEQLGLPIPGLPVLIAAGSIISTGRLSLLPCIGLILLASVSADLLWYYIGRAKGVHILHFICRISWKPNTCIATTKGVFMRFGAQTLLFAKFVPGLNTLAPPLAGSAGITLRRFLIYDTIGAAIWGILPLLAGMGLRKAIPSTAVLVADIRGHLPAIGIALLLAFIGWRFVRRRIYLRQLHDELERGVTIDELREMIDRGDDLVLLDIRHPINFGFHPVLIPQAMRIGYHEIEARLPEIPLDKPLIAYCDCPGDQASVLVVQALHRLGAKSARVLKGGLEEWESRGYETVALPGLSAAL